MKLILIRHGQTDRNAEQRISGQVDAMLTDRGRRQAKLLAQRLRDEKITHIFASDLTRAIDTAAEISALCGVSIEQIPALRERNYGDLEGRSSQEYVALVTASGLSRPEFRPPGGETFMELEARVATFMPRLKSFGSDDTVVIVAHGGTNRRILGFLLSGGGEYLGAQDNCCVNIIEIGADGTARAILHNCTMHLASLDSE